jgi:hypothetical protein
MMFPDRHKPSLAFGGLHPETLAALGTTGANDCTTTAGLHAHEEAVRTLAAHY